MFTATTINVNSALTASFADDLREAVFNPAADFEFTAFPPAVAEPVPFEDFELDGPSEADRQWAAEQNDDADPDDLACERRFYEGTESAFDRFYNEMTPEAWADLDDQNAMRSCYDLGLAYC